MLKKTRLFSLKLNLFKITLFVLLFFQAHIMLSQNIKNEVEQVVNNFMTAMSKQDKLDNYVKDVNNRMVNYFMVKDYKIKEINNDKVIVEIDHGKGVYCTRIYLTIINSNSVYQLKSYANKNPQLVNPWERKEKICN